MTSPDNLARASKEGEARRVCILTGGGDAPGLNAVLRAFVKTAMELGIEVLGSEDGFEGLIEEPGRVVPMTRSTVRGILPKGGSIVGCSNRADPFAFVPPDTDGAEPRDISKKVKKKLEALEVDALVLIGGDGTMSIGMKFMNMGVPVVGIPKTIDNDLAATDVTFGLDTAVSTATWAIDALHSTAEAHDRVAILEVMGRHAGWIALYAGLAGGADAILIPEIPYDVDRVVSKIKGRAAKGHHFSIIVIGEGAKPLGGTVSTISQGSEGVPARLGGAGEHLAALIDGQVRHDVRVTVLGHLQRGGSPSAMDRILGTRFGVHGAQLCQAGEFGRLVALRGAEITSVPLEAAVAKPKRVPIDGELIVAARALGIELGC